MNDKENQPSAVAERIDLPSGYYFEQSHAPRLVWLKRPDGSLIDAMWRSDAEPFAAAMRAEPTAPVVAENVKPTLQNVQSQPVDVAMQAAREITKAARTHKNDWGAVVEQAAAIIQRAIHTAQAADRATIALLEREIDVRRLYASKEATAMADAHLAAADEPQGKRTM